jgi:hypothetical protein
MVLIPDMDTIAIENVAIFVKVYFPLLSLK